MTELQRFELRGREEDYKLEVSWKVREEQP